MTPRLSCLALATLAGCGGYLPSFENHSTVPEQFAVDVIEAVEADDHAGPIPNLHHFTLVMWPTIERSWRACNKRGDGCVHIANKTIHVPFTDDAGQSAELLCHELGHMFYRWDNDHTHTEWFGRDGADSVCSRIEARFGSPSEPTTELGADEAL